MRATTTSISCPRDETRRTSKDRKRGYAIATTMERLEIGVLMSEQAATAIFTRERLDSVLSELRPKLHRYCARMTGSVIDAEDIVQEAIVKAIEAFPQAGSIATAEGWLIRRTIRRSIFFGAAPDRRPLVLTRISRPGDLDHVANYGGDGSGLIRLSGATT